VLSVGFRPFCRSTDHGKGHLWLAECGEERIGARRDDGHAAFGFASPAADSKRGVKPKWRTKVGLVDDRMLFSSA